MIGKVIFRFHKLWQLHQLLKMRSRITLVVLPQKRTARPLLGRSKRHSVVCAFMCVYQSGFCAGKGKAHVLSVTAKKDLKGGKKCGAAAEQCCSLSFAEHACFLWSLCKSNSTAEEKEKNKSRNEYLASIVLQGLEIHKYT